MELTTADLTLRELTLINAVRKGRSVCQGDSRRSVVLAADTLVGLDGRILGKPSNLAHARKMLRRLNGRTHQVYTSVFIGQPGRGCITLTEFSFVTFHRLKNSEIDEYLKETNPLDKAGGYGAQDRVFVANITGSRSNVIGLPMETTTRALRGFGIRARRS